MTLRRKLGWVAVLYFAEGLPFGVVKEVMPVYLRVSGVDLTAIGLYVADRSAVDAEGPLVAADRSLRRPPHVDRRLPRRAAPSRPRCCGTRSRRPRRCCRRGHAARSPFASATQDIAIDAYTIGLVEPRRGGQHQRRARHRGARRADRQRRRSGAALDRGSAGRRCSRSPPARSRCSRWWCRGRRAVATSPASRQHWLEPLRDWVARPGASAVFTFVLLYKLGDATMGPMVKPFWLDHGLSVGEVGVVSSTVGMFATIAGAHRRRPLHRPLRHLARAALARPGAGAVQPRLRDRRLARSGRSRRPPSRRSPTRSPRSAIRRGR